MAPTLCPNPALEYQHRSNPRSEGSTMKLTIFGATGVTGIILTRQSLAAGHSVTAVVRDPSRLAVPQQPKVTQEGTGVTQWNR